MVCRCREMAGWLAKKVDALLAAHVQDVGDVPVLERDVEGVAVVAGALADLARHVHVGQEVHLDLDGAVAGAGLAATAGHVEREPAGQVAAHLGLVGLGEQLADVVEHAGVGGRVRAGRAADRRLVDVDDLVDLVEALDGLVAAGRRARAVDLLHQRPEEDVVDERGLARARHAGDGDEGAERELDVDVLEVVLAGAAHDELAGVGGAALLGHRDDLAARDVLAGERVLRLQQALHRAGVDDVAAVLARAGADVDDVVGDLDGVLVVLDDEHRVAEVAQAHERVDEAAVVALVQADRRLVEHVEHARRGRSRSGRPGGCAGPRRRRGCRPSGRG